MKKVLQRFVDVWKPDFLNNLTTSKEKTLSTTIWFWILSGVLATLIWTIVISFTFSRIIPELIEEMSSELSDDMGITLVNGELSTQNIEEPFVISETDESGSSYLVVIDTISDQYGLEDLEKNDGGVVVLRDSMYLKGNDKVRFVDFENAEDFFMTVAEAKEKINEYSGIVVFLVGLVVFIVALFIFTIFRLLTALWWALILFVLSLIMKEEISYGKAYESTLNFYFIPLVLEGLLLITVGFVFPFSTFVIFLILFSINLFHIKNNKSGEENKENEKKEDIDIEKSESKEETTEQV